MEKALRLTLQDVTHQLTVTELWQIMLPGQEGMTTLLPSHAPMLIGLTNGVVRMVPNHTFYFLAGGLARIERNHCHIITRFFSPLSDLQPDTVSLKLDTLQERRTTLQEANEILALNDEIRLYQDVLAFFRTSSPRT